MKKLVLVLSIGMLTNMLIGCSGSSDTSTPSTVNSVETPSNISVVTAQ